MAALGEIHARPELAVPVLPKALHDADPHVRGSAIGLRDFGLDAKAAVPALLELLKDENSYAKGMAVAALREIAPEILLNAGFE